MLNRIVQWLKWSKPGSHLILWPVWVIWSAMAEAFFPVMWLTFCFPNIAIITIPAASLMNNFKGAAGSVLNKGRTCPKLNGVWYYERETLTQTASSLFLFVTREKLGWMSMRSSGERRAAHFFPKLNRPFTGHYNVINRHQIIFWTRMLFIVVGILRFKRDIFPFIDQS